MTDPEDREWDLSSLEDHTDLKPDVEAIEQLFRSEWGNGMWYSVEALSACHLTHLIKDSPTFGLLLEGSSSSGKTTALEFFREIEDQFEWRDSVTPASFVSHDPSRSEEELRNTDLLPQIRHKTLIVPDMAGWIGDDMERVRDRMSKLVRILDGKGYQSQSGTHGERGYSGDYRFLLFGATTPITDRTWDVMGRVGNRFVVLEHVEATQEELTSSLFGDTDSSQGDCTDALKTLLQSRWESYGGFGGLSWESRPNSEQQTLLFYLSDIVRYGRGIVRDGAREIEGQPRLLQTLVTVAKGSALLHDRTHLENEDFHLCSRIALSTIPHKRRKLIRRFLNPSTSSTLSAADVAEVLGLSRKTALGRIKELASLGLVKIEEIDGRGTKEARLRSQFQWPDDLLFPQF